MPRTARAAAAVFTTVVAAAATARADYDTHPGLAPGVRCAAIGVDSPDCQELFWDLPAATAVGERSPAVAGTGSAYENGRTDRPPPLYVADTDGDGLPDAGFEEPGPGRTRLCPDVDEIPWWKPTGETDGGGHPVFEVACRRGTRIHYGPWQTGSDPNVYDKLVRAIVRFANSERLDRDGVPDDDRREWNTGVEIYNHVASHHGTCRNPADPWAKGCNDPENPARASSPECQGPDYQGRYDECPMESPKEGHCQAYQDFAVQARTATQYPGRFSFEYPDGRALVSLENQLWTCNHHVVTALTLAGVERNFRRQEGGTVGEMVIQHFTAPLSDATIEPLSFLGVGLMPVLTTFYPPYTVGASSGVWYAPYDLELGVLAIHAHKRMVKGTVDALPVNPIRGRSPDPDCGGSAVRDANGLYVSWEWDDNETCEYWRDPDGPVVLRKGQALRWHCTVNNGVTPDAIRQLSRTPERSLGPAGGNLRETLDGLGVDEAELASDALAGSPATRDLLWGRQNPAAYRVRYGCETRENVPPGLPPTASATVCDPNPATDEDGRPIDGPYENPEQCGAGTTGRCAPANIVFANVAEDEMCLLFGLYWPLHRPVDVDLNAVRTGNLEDAVIARPDDVASLVEDPSRVERTGTPGALLKQLDDGGICNGCTKTGIAQIDSPPSDETNIGRFR